MRIKNQVFMRWLGIGIVYVFLSFIYLLADYGYLLVPTFFGDWLRLAIIFGFVLCLTTVFPALTLVLYPLFAFYFLFPYSLILSPNHYLAGYLTLTPFYDVLIVFLIAYILGSFFYTKISIIYELLGRRI